MSFLNINTSTVHLNYGIESGLLFNFKCVQHALCLPCYERIKSKKSVVKCAFQDVMVLIDDSNIWIQAKKSSKCAEEFLRVRMGHRKSHGCVS